MVKRIKSFACIDGKPRRLGAANDAVEIREVPAFQRLVEKNTDVTQLHFGGHRGECIVLQTERKVVNVKRRTHTDALLALCHVERRVVYARGNFVPFGTLKVFRELSTLGQTSPLGPVHFRGRSAVSRVEVKTFRIVLATVQRKCNNQAVPGCARHFKTDTAYNLKIADLAR